MARPVEHGLGRALHQVADGVAPLGSGLWRFALTNGSAVAARARIAEGWLELTAAVPNASPTTRDALAWLQFNARTGPVRAARPTGAPGPELRGEWFVDHEAALDACVAAACDEVRAAVHDLDACDTEAPRLSLDAWGPDAARTDLERICAEAGWPIASAAAGEHVVGVERARDPRLDLHTRAGDFTARFGFRTGSPDLLIVDLVDLAEQPAVCREAVATLLLAVSAAVRSVKGLVVDGEGTMHAALASSLRSADAGAVDRAASALAVGCEVTAREAQALCDEHLAADYLARWGATRHQHVRHTKEERACLQQP